MPHTMSLIGLILMIFTSVFGFANSPSAYYLMGYSAIPFYIFSALLFFIPFALMMAEMGAAYRKEEGGIYSWMNVVFLLYHLDGEYLRESLGTVLNIPLW